MRGLLEWALSQRRGLDDPDPVPPQWEEMLEAAYAGLPSVADLGPELFRFVAFCLLAWAGILWLDGKLNGTGPGQRRLW